MTVPAGRLSMPVRRRIAGELEHMRAEIERLGAILCSDPDLAARHIGALQALDAIGQQQMALAAVLRATDAPAAIRGTPLEALRERLEQALDEDAAG